MFKRTLAIAVAVITMACFCTSGYALSFKDIESHWAKSYIEILSDKGIMNGYSDGTFRPEETIQVDEFIKMLILVKGYKVKNVSATDISVYIDKAFELNLVISGEFFDFKRPITRQEMARMAIRAIGGTLNQSIDKYIDVLKDYHKISKRFQPYVLQAVVKGIIVGYEDGNFRAENNATRAEAAATLVRIVDESKRVPPKK